MILFQSVLKHQIFVKLILRFNNLVILSMIYTNNIISLYLLRYILN